MTWEGDTIQPTTSRATSHSCWPCTHHLSSHSLPEHTFLPQFSHLSPPIFPRATSWCNGKEWKHTQELFFFLLSCGRKKKAPPGPQAVCSVQLPDRGTSRAIPAGPGCHKIREKWTGDWTKPEVVWMLFAHLAADEWAWTEPHLRNENKTQSRHQCSICTGKQRKDVAILAKSHGNKDPKEIQSPTSQTRRGFPDWKYFLMVSTSNPQVGLSGTKT